MADFLCDLAGDDAVVSWASRVVRSATGAESAVKGEPGTDPAAAWHRRAGGELRRCEPAWPGPVHPGPHGRGAERSRLVRRGAAPHAVRRHPAPARLVAARLDRADLTGADLREADLTQARLIGADLREARMTGARLDRAVLVGATLDPGALATTASTFGTAVPGSPAQVQMGHASTVNAVAAAPGGLLATGHADGAVRLWDPDRAWLRHSLTPCGRRWSTLPTGKPPLRNGPG